MNNYKNFNYQYQFGGMKYLLSVLQQKNILHSPHVYRTMLQVDRKDFTKKNPYEDHSQYISHNSVISAPHIHCYALEYLEPFVCKGCHILDVGFGSGYLTVALSKLIEDTGVVVGIEHIKELYDTGYSNICKNFKYLIDNKKIVLSLSDGRKGFLKYAPYKAIHVGAAAPDQVPQELINQLDKGGRMFIPIGNDSNNQWIYIIDKDLNGNLKSQKILSVCYVPLTSVQKQLNPQNK